MTAMEYAEKLIADKERDKTVFDNSQRNLIVNFAYKLDDRAATEELANNLAAAAVAAENTEEINRLMWEAEEKIEKSAGWHDRSFGNARIWVSER